jgi:hypothetical protein
MSVMRTIYALGAALALSGCAGYSNYSGVIAQSHAEYERAVLAGDRSAPPRRAYASKRARPVVAAERPRQVEASTIGGSLPQATAPALDPGMRQRQTAPSRDPAVVPASGAADAALVQSPNPMASPAWEREHAQWRQMENDLKRKLESICRGC